MPMVLPAVKPRITHKRIESQVRMLVSPALQALAKLHFPEISDTSILDLTEGVADYVASSFESYVEDYEAELIGQIEEQKAAMAEDNFDDNIDRITRMEDYV